MRVIKTYKNRFERSARNVLLSPELFRLLKAITMAFILRSLLDGEQETLLKSIKVENTQNGSVFRNSNWVFCYPNGKIRACVGSHFRNIKMLILNLE